MPPFKLADDIFRDTYNLAKGKIDEKGFRTISDIPLVGKMLYWWFGGGKKSQKKKSKGISLIPKQSLFTRLINIITKDRGTKRESKRAAEVWSNFKPTDKKNFLKQASEQTQLSEDELYNRLQQIKKRK